jgi:hypothetical protein
VRQRWPKWIDALVAGLALCWLVGIVIEVTVDQIEVAPPRPPTPAETAAAAPAARAKWRLVYAQLVRRLPNQPRPLELGAVWSTRDGRICGLVNRWDTGVDNMTPFYTVDLHPVFKREDERRYMRVWLKCRFDPWVPLHQGTYDTGLCATRLGRRLCAHDAFGPPVTMWGQ